MKNCYFIKSILCTASIGLTCKIMAQTLVYNTAPASVQPGATIIAGISPTEHPSLSTSLSRIFGDRLQTTAGGKLSEFGFTYYCSGSSTGNLVSGTQTIRFYAYDASATLGFGPSLGSISVSLGALSKGYYRFETVSNLESLNIVLPQDFIVTQQFSNVVGATKMGVVAESGSLASYAIGTSTDGYYIETPPTAGTWGFITPPANLIYSVKVVPVPEPATYAGLAAFGLVGFATWRRVRR